MNLVVQLQPTAEDRNSAGQLENVRATGATLALKVERQTHLVKKVPGPTISGEQLVSATVSTSAQITFFLRGLC